MFNRKKKKIKELEATIIGLRIANQGYKDRASLLEKHIQEQEKKISDLEIKFKDHKKLCIGEALPEPKKKNKKR